MLPTKFDECFNQKRTLAQPFHVYYTTLHLPLSLAQNSQNLSHGQYICKWKLKTRLVSNENNPYIIIYTYIVFLQSMRLIKIYVFVFADRILIIIIKISKLAEIRQNDKSTERQLCKEIKTTQHIPWQCVYINSVVAQVRRFHWIPCSNTSVLPRNHSACNTPRPDMYCSDSWHMTPCIGRDRLQKKTFTEYIHL